MLGNLQRQAGLEQTSHWRDLAGWAGAGFCLLALLALLDGLIGSWREPASVLKLLPGQAQEINGPLLEEVKNTRELIYFSDSDDLQVQFVELSKGYFLGGDLWRGELTVSPRIRPGEYHLTVAPRQSTSVRTTPAFRIVVFSDPGSLQRSSKSLLRRLTGFSPWWLAVLCLPGILLFFGAVFLISQKLDHLLTQAGRAEIYRVLRREGAFEIHFGLGADHGVLPGQELRIRDPRGRDVGLARVESTTPGDAVALVSADQEIRPGFWVTTGIN